jgi:hypothetical protein
MKYPGKFKKHVEDPRSGKARKGKLKNTRDKFELKRI